MVGRVVGIYGQRVEVASLGRSVRAIVRGRLKYGESDSSLIAVGDYVELFQRPNEIAMIDKICGRGSCISRPAVEKEGIIQIIVSNVDRMVIVTSLAEPSFKSGLVDRFLVIAFKENIHPVLVINKIDLSDPKEVATEIDAWRRISVDVLCSSAVTGDGIESLKNILRTGTSVIVGHSGVGKSSLLNRVNPDLKLKIGRISGSLRGTHATSRVSLFQIFPDGWVADTPGLRDLGLVGVTKKNLRDYFPDIAQLDTPCQFANCAHIKEPGCAVKKTVGEPNPEIAAFRFKNYKSIYESLTE